MTNRRSLDDALSPEEQAFLKETAEEDSIGQTDQSLPDPQKPEPQLPPEKAAPLRSGVVSLNVRISQELGAELLRVSLQRKMAGEALHTQKDIVEEALRDWLGRY